MKTVLVMSAKGEVGHSALVKVYAGGFPLAAVGWQEGVVIQFAPSTITPFRSGDPIRTDSKYFRIMRIESAESDIEAGVKLTIIHFEKIGPATAL